jgi:Cellulase (glycosyl hydrolase family 5)/Carbohydrate binding domain
MRMTPSNIAHSRANISGTAAMTRRATVASTLLIAALVATTVTPASAQAPYDRSLENSVGSSAEAAVPYPVTNPGFEGDFVAPAECANITGEVAPGWNDNTCWDSSAPGIRYERDSTAPHTGESAQKITLESGSRVQFTQSLSAPLQPGTKYTVSYWMRAESPTYVTTYLRDSGPPYVGYSSKITKLTPTWSEYTFDGFVEQSTISLFIAAGAPGSFSIDDVSITSTPEAAFALDPPARSVPRSYFGVHLNYLETPWPTVADRVGSVRMWDTDRRSDGTGTGSQWADVNQAQGVYDWSGLDARVALARANRADIVYTLGGRTPRWASGQPDAISPYGFGQCAQPATDAIWETWIRDIATRYKGKIRLWEIWNEPDLSGFYCGTPDQLIDLAERASTILREVDPKNRVLSPGFSGFEGPGYLDYFLRNGGLSTFDILSYHFYADTPELNLTARLQNLRSVMISAGARNKPVWNTEQGWIPGGAAPVTQSTGAAYIARAYLLNWSAGATRYYYYYWDNNAYLPLIEDDGTTLTQSGLAYREVAGWMIGRTVTSVTTDTSGTYIVTLRASSGAISRAVWNPDSTAEVSIAADWRATEKLDLTGGRSSLAGATTIEVGESPVLIR